MRIDFVPLLAVSMGLLSSSSAYNPTTTNDDYDTYTETDTATATSTITGALETCPPVVVVNTITFINSQLTCCAFVDDTANFLLGGMGTVGYDCAFLLLSFLLRTLVTFPNCDVGTVS